MCWCQERVQERRWRYIAPPSYETDLVLQERRFGLPRMSVLSLPVVPRETRWQWRWHGECSLGQTTAPPLAGENMPLMDM